MSGFVTLVGAGPGDPGLLTVKGRLALEQAQVVVYDRLVSPKLLELVPPSAIQINVGKTAGHHPVPQGEINRILLEQALSGKRVVRLKGGDPFLFGRGGEELQVLADHHIPFAVVPGVTSAIAVPAYAGIPVTHRGCSSSLHIITGHARAGKELEMDFEGLVRAGGTLVFLMGVTALPRICQGLLQAGMDPDTPAAIIEKGTCPEQRRVIATLSTLSQRAEESRITSPAISVFGQVCDFGNQLDWYHTRTEKTVIVTRPRQRMTELVQPLEQLGARVLEYPCIKIDAPLEGVDWMEPVEKLSRYQWVVFTSPEGPGLFCRALLQQGGDLRRAAHLKFAVIGPGTEAALGKVGFRFDLMPEVYDSQHLARALVQEGAQDVLLFRSAQGSRVLPEILAQHHIRFEDVACYRTVCTRPDPAPVLAALERGEVLVTFTSALTVRGFAESLPPGTDISRITACCIGEVTGQQARDLGFVTRVAEKATIPGLVQLVRSRL